jgi:hypothetical protein
MMEILEPETAERLLHTLAFNNPYPFRALSTELTLV